MALGQRVTAAERAARAAEHEAAIKRLVRDTCWTEAYVRQEWASTMADLKRARRAGLGGVTLVAHMAEQNGVDASDLASELAAQGVVL